MAKPTMSQVEERGDSTHPSSLRKRILRLNALPVRPPSDSSMDAKALEDHRNRVSWQISQNFVLGMAECVITRDRVAYVDCQGHADQEHGTEVTQKTLFRCFSMTKPITAVAVMRLVEEGKIALDDPVAKYIPSFAHTQVVKPEAAKTWGVTNATRQYLEPQSRPMTIRHLLTHTSGLGYGADRFSIHDKLPARCPVEDSYKPLTEAVDTGRIQSLAAFCDALAELPLRFQPGTRYLYSYGVDVAGRVIEVASGMSLDSYLRQKVLRPCGMSRTTFSINSQTAADLAAMYKADLKGRKNRGPNEAPKVRLTRVDGTSPEESLWFGQPPILAGGGMIGSLPRGGLLTCLKDMAMFVNMLINSGVAASGRRVLQTSTVRSLWRDWLSLRSITGSSKRVRGWKIGRTIGWSPLGHVRVKDKCLYMGGWTTSWAVYPKWQVGTVSLSQTMQGFDLPNWKKSRDELESVVEALHKRQRHDPAEALRVEKRRRNSVMSIKKRRKCLAS